MAPRAAVATTTTSRYLYEKIADGLAAQIHSGALRAGERCPSVRALCESHGVSLSTAVQALALLESRGLIEARPQSGFYVKPQLDAAYRLPSARPGARVVVGKVETGTLIADVVAAARSAKAIPLGAATVGGDLLPGAAILRSMQAAMRDLGVAGLAYEMPPGNLELRRQIARRSLAAGITVAPDDVLITTGSMEAIGLCLRAVTKPGDTVAVESPMFYGIIELLCVLGLKTAEIPTHPVTGIDLAQLRATIATRKIAACVAIPNFNNPLGCKMPDDAKRELVKMLARADIPLIEDDVYGDLQHDGARPITAKSFDTLGNVLLCSSFSKTLSSGLRVGWVLAGRHQARVAQLKFVNTIATATIPQAAVADFLARGGYDRHLRRLRAALCTRLHAYSDAVQRHFPAGTRLSTPAGGFVLWLQLPAGVDALTLYQRAQDRGINITPGPAFSCGLGKFQDCIRLSCGAALDAPMEAALKTLGREVAHLAKT